MEKALSVIRQISTAIYVFLITMICSILMNIYFSNLLSIDIDMPDLNSNIRDEEIENQSNSQRSSLEISGKY